MSQALPITPIAGLSESSGLTGGDDSLTPLDLSRPAIAVPITDPDINGPVPRLDTGPVLGLGTAPVPGLDTEHGAGRVTRRVTGPLTAPVIEPDFKSGSGPGSGLGSGPGTGLDTGPVTEPVIEPGIKLNDEPNTNNLITEDDEPVDNIFSAKQQRLLTDSLYSSWVGPGEGRKFLADTNVGIFYVARNPAIVPNVFLSLDVEAHEDLRAQEHRAYFTWEFGKPPDVVIEIVSHKNGGEISHKKTKYAHMRVAYYVIFDPEQQLSSETLIIYRLDGLGYRRHESMRMPELNLGVTLWEGEFEGARGKWMRWTDENNNLIPTGREQAMVERKEREKERVEKEAALERVARLAAMLHRLGRNPDQI